MTNIKTLVLRNCSITGEIPLYLGDRMMKNLDLSFNKLTGQIPSNFDQTSADFIYLTGNALTGPVPEWMLTFKQYIDLSYNNLRFESSGSPSCEVRNVNVFGSSSLGNNSTEVVPCLRSFKCPKSYYSFHINCGGGEVIANERKTYEHDTDPGSASRFFQSGSNWAYSSTGNFRDDENDNDKYIATNTSILMMKDSRLYRNARLSPISLTYYGFCLLNGNYTVNLYFAEIMFTSDGTFNSLGRRLFDIYIQGKLVLKDFNIVDEAGGAGKAVIKKFTAVVTGTTLEIRFHWAGKGTVGIPFGGIYGPLVSAVSVDPGDIPTGPERQTNVNVLLQSCKFLALQRYKYSDIKAMTKSFKNILGQGGYGRVFKGTLRNDGRLVAVKVLNESKNNGEEFINEVVTIGRTNHVNVVCLLGFCIEGTKRALVYEFMPNGSLERYIYNEKTLSSGSTHLGWEKLYQIALGIARGLEYLHCRCNTRIVHFDIKPHNILLDQDFLPKISDFGMAKLCPTKESIVSMVGARGTMGYIAPEFSCRNLGGVSHKSDVYSYGMMVLEMIGGRKNLDVTVENMSGIYFPHWIYNQLKQDLEPVEELEEINVEGVEEILKDETAKKMIMVALWCIQTHPTNRPSMTKVVEMLEGSSEQLLMPPNPSLDPHSVS